MGKTSQLPLLRKQPGPLALKEVLKVLGTDCQLTRATGRNLIDRNRLKLIK